MLKCTDNDTGECECEDGSICKWWKGDTNDNCPCGGGPRRKKAGGKRRGGGEDM